MSSFLNDIKFKFKRESIVTQLIYINIGVFVLAALTNILDGPYEKFTFMREWAAMPSLLQKFIYRPWTIITYGFLHIHIVHILFNLIGLYFIGNLFIDYFTQKDLLRFYVWGTIFGGMFFLSYYNFVLNKDEIMIGASAGVYAVFIGIATHIPNYAIRLPLIGNVKLWVLASFFVVINLVLLEGNNTGGKLAHLGGALFGYLAVKYPNWVDFSNIEGLFKRKKKLKTVHKSAFKTSKEKERGNQKRIDEILDKIGKSGYETLSKEEKDFLFQQKK